MRAVVWHGQRDLAVEEVADPTIVEPTDAIVRITTTGLCGSDLHLYEVLAPFMTEGDILGHEPMGVVEEVGSAVGELRPGDRVVIPFQIACGSCFMCDAALQTQYSQLLSSPRVSDAATKQFGLVYEDPSQYGYIDLAKK